MIRRATGFALILWVVSIPAHALLMTFGRIDIEDAG